MPTRDSAPLGAPCWIDLATSDTSRATAFYGEIFGWDAVDAGPGYGGYINCFRGGLPVAGMMQNEPGSGYPDAWTTYLATADAEATTTAARAGGAQVVVEPMTVGTKGAMAVYTDPSGAEIGAWQAAEHIGYGAREEHGAPIWHELHTTSYTEAVAFYRRVFDWDTQVVGDTDDFRYTVLLVDGVQRAGIMDASGWLLPTGGTSTWQVYFGSEDVAATLSQVTALGGRVVQGIEETPYGQLATAADPTGAQFKVKSLQR